MAGTTLDLVQQEGYRNKAQQALSDLEEEVYDWVNSHRPVSDGENLEQFLPNAVARRALKKVGLDAEVLGENVEHTLHEAEHVLIDDSFDLRGEGSQTSKGQVDALLDEFVISMLAKDTSYDSPHRLAHAVRDMAREIDASLPVLDALSKVQSSNADRQRAWKTALRRAGEASGDKASAFADAILDTLPLERDPVAREVEERMRSYYAHLVAQVEKARKEFRQHVQKVESQHDGGAREALQE